MLYRRSWWKRHGRCLVYQGPGPGGAQRVSYPHSNPGLRNPHHERDQYAYRSGGGHQRQPYVWWPQVYLGLQLYGKGDTITLLVLLYNFEVLINNLYTTM